MTDWADGATADPVGDIKRAALHVYRQRGLAPSQIIMSQATAEALQHAEEMRKMWEAELAELPRWAFIRRIKLERKVSFWTWRKLLPIRVRRLLTKIDHRHADWKHRNDPYWEPWNG